MRGQWRRRGIIQLRRREHTGRRVRSRRRRRTRWWMRMGILYRGLTTELTASCWVLERCAGTGAGRVMLQLQLVVGSGEWSLPNDDVTSLEEPWNRCRSPLIAYGGWQAQSDRTDTVGWLSMPVVLYPEPELHPDRDDGRVLRLGDHASYPREGAVYLQACDVSVNGWQSHDVHLDFAAHLSFPVYARRDAVGLAPIRAHELTTASNKMFGTSRSCCKRFRPLSSCVFRGTLARPTEYEQKCNPPNVIAGFPHNDLQACSAFVEYRG
jgi:hypothetical protein